MKFTIVVVTPDLRVAEFVRQKNTAIIPPAQRVSFEAHGMAFSAVAFHATELDGSEFVHFVRREMRSAEGVVLLCDARLEHSAARYTDALFLALYDDGGQANLHNFFGKLLPPVLRNFIFYWSRFADEKSRKILLLPLKNFVAQELVDLRNLLAREATAPNFATNLDQLLSQLYARRTPKEYRKYRSVYLLDDRRNYFEYGHEKHKAIETTVPPHSVICGMNAVFRFGAKYDDCRHFNVSRGGEDEKISDIFAKCHGRPVPTGSHTHINMFPNGFY